MNDDMIRPPQQGKTTTHYKSVKILDGTRASTSIYTYDKELTNELRTNGGKHAIDIWKNQMLPITTDDEAKAQGEENRKSNIDPTDKDAHKKHPGYANATGFYSQEHQLDVRKSLKEKVYAAVFSSTKGAARQIVEGKGADHIEEARGSLIGRFGKSAPTNTKDNEKNFTGGTPDAKEMEEGDDPRVYLQSMEALQQTLIDDHPNEDIGNYAPGKPEALLMNVINGLAANYTPCVSLHSQWMRMTDDLSASIPTNENLKAKTEPTAKYEELKKMLNEHYESLKKQKKSNKREYENVPALALRIGESSYASNKNCYDCGQEGHLIGDRECQEPTAMKNYPESWEKRPMSKAIRALEARNGKGSERKCHFWASGNCNQGESCRFVHEGTPTPHSMAKAKQSLSNHEIDNTEKAIVAVLQRQQERKKQKLFDEAQEAINARPTALDTLLMTLAGN